MKAVLGGLALIAAGAAAGSAIAPGDYRLRPPQRQARDTVVYRHRVHTISYPPAEGDSGLVWCVGRRRPVRGTGASWAEKLCAIPDDSTVVWWLLLEPERPETVTITVSSAAFDVRLMLRSAPAGALLAMNDDAAGACDARIRATLLPGRAYYVVVGQHERASGPFAIDIAARDSIVSADRCLTPPLPLQAHSLPAPDTAPFLRLWNAGARAESSAAWSPGRYRQDDRFVVIEGAQTLRDPPLGADSLVSQRWNLKVEERLDTFHLAVRSVVAQTLYLLGPVSTMMGSVTSEPPCQTSTLRALGLPPGEYRVILAGGSRRSARFSAIVGPATGALPTCPTRDVNAVRIDSLSRPFDTSFVAGTAFGEVWDVTDLAGPPGSTALVTVADSTAGRLALRAWDGTTLRTATTELDRCSASLRLTFPHRGLVRLEVSGTINAANGEYRFRVQPAGADTTRGYCRRPDFAARTEPGSVRALAAGVPVRTILGHPDSTYPELLRPAQMLEDSTYALGVRVEGPVPGSWAMVESVAFEPKVWLVTGRGAFGDDDHDRGCSAVLLRDSVVTGEPVIWLVVNSRDRAGTGLFSLRLVPGRMGAPCTATRLAAARAGRFFQVEQVPFVDTLVLEASRAIRGGSLTPDDPRLVVDSTLAEAWLLRVDSVAPGGSLVFDLSSATFDSWLIVIGPDRTLEDDDGGGGTNSRVVYPQAPPGSYRIVVNSWGTDGTGPYTLQVMAVAGGLRK